MFLGLILDIATGMMSSVLLTLLLLSILLSLSDKVERYSERTTMHADDADPLFVTIVVPFRNDDTAQLRQLLNSLLRLDWPRELLEVLIVDDSDQATYRKVREIVREFENVLNIKLLHRSTPSGYKAGALMYALEHARGDVIAVLDVDTHPYPHFLKRLCNYLKAGFDYAQALTRFKSVVDTLTSRIILMQEELLNRIVTSNYRIAFTLRGHSFVIWRHVLKSVGSLDVPHARLTEDVELTVRLKLMGYRGVLIKEALTTGLAAPTYGAYLLQRARWVIGGLIVLSKHMLRLLRSRVLALREKFEFLHNYVSRLSTVVMSLMCVLVLLYYTFSLSPGVVVLVILLVTYVTVLVYFSLLCIFRHSGLTVRDLPYLISSSLLWASTSLFLTIYAVALRKWYVTPKSPKAARGWSLLLGLIYSIFTTLLSGLAVYASLIVAQPLAPLCMYLLAGSAWGLALSICDNISLLKHRNQRAKH